jgi:hypothetical protein
MGFSNKGSKNARNRLLHKEKSGPPPRARQPLGSIVALAVGALLLSVWALHRHYSFQPRPMLVPEPSPAVTYDPDAGETPVPELLR